MIHLWHEGDHYLAAWQEQAIKPACIPGQYPPGAATTDDFPSQTLDPPTKKYSVKAAGRLSQEARHLEPLASIAQQMVSYAMAFVRRGQELGFLRRDLPDDLLFDLLAALDQSSDTWLLARLRTA
jgi:hypothetical protein